MQDFIWFISSYFVIWWLVLFTVLPLGVRSHKDEGTDVEAGNDPGAPVNPNLKRKAITTSWVALIVTAVVWTIFETGLVKIGP